MYKSKNCRKLSFNKISLLWIQLRKNFSSNSCLFVRASLDFTLKSVVFGDYRAKLSEDINWTGGGIFKYYSLEQYENTLARSIYSDTQLSIFDSNSHFSKYIFLTDKKLTDFIKNSENDININFDDLYENIDIPETISNLTGCPIIALSDEEVILDNSGTKLKYKINPSNMNLEEKKKLLLLLKPLLWWGD